MSNNTVMKVLNDLGFEIERSSGGKVFYKLGEHKFCLCFSCNFFALTTNGWDNRERLTRLGMDFSEEKLRSELRQRKIIV